MYTATATVPVNYWVMPNVKVLNEFTPAGFIDATCAAFDITRFELLSHCRKRKWVRARYVCMYLIRLHTNQSLLTIGKLFDRDHTTVMYGIEYVKNELDVTAYRQRMNEDLRRVMELV